MNNFIKKNSSNFSKNIIKNNSTKNIIPKTNTYKNINVKIIIISIIFVILISFLIYILINFYNYNDKNCYIKKQFFDYITDFNDSNICIQETAPIKPKPISESNFNIPFIESKEVFHIANQDYTFDQAKCKCESYGATLATKDQMIDAYNKGANWCTYGWINNQNAYYPVQKCDWDKMQAENERLPNHQRKFCGMPGLNGGYFSNPQLKFGINCYGVKPKGSVNKLNKPYCPPMNFCKLDTNFQAANKLDTDEITSFNNEKWNMNV